MDFRILGLLEVSAGGQLVELQGAKLRALLAVLLLHDNQVVSTEQLVEALWGDDATSSSPNSLRLHVSHLRRALGANAIVTRPPGYLLAVDPARIDAREFERLATEGRRALNGGDVATAHSTLTDALALWRGSALADFRYAPFAQAEAARLEELRLVATEDLVESELALGRHGDAVGKLQSLVEQHPLRERLWASLMLALYRCDRQAESLRAYQFLRRVLADELGIEPSRTLQRLEESILLQKPELDLVPIDQGGGPPRTELGSHQPTPLPRHLANDARPATFVGREEQLAVLANALEEVEARGSRRVALIGGEPGIGKTTLVSEFARDAHARGAVVLYGRCDESAGIAYQPWAAAVAHLLEHPPSGLVADIGAAHGADLAHLGPEVSQLAFGASVRSGDPETARHLLFGTVVQLLETAGRNRLVVLVLDDLQWADLPSLMLLRHVVTSQRPMSLLVVGTFRDSDLAANSALADLLAALRREAGVVRLDLAGLNADELLALVKAGIGDLAEGVVLSLRDRIARETNGNPFFVGELLRHVVEQELIRRDPEGQWVTTADLQEHWLPAGVREVIGRRVALLGETAVRALSMAAVIGRDFDLNILATASDTAVDTLLDFLDAAVAARLVMNVSGEQYSFVHALVQHALHDSLTPARRARAHRRAADAIELACGNQVGLRAGELALHHIEAGAAGDRAKAVTYASSAGDEALAQLAPDEALRWYGEALDLLSPPSAGDERQRARLLAGLGDAQRQMGVPTFHETLLEAARLAQRLGDTDTLVATVLANHRGSMTRTGFADLEWVPIIEAALAALGRSDAGLRARLLGLLALERFYDEHDASRRALTDEALGIARRLGDPATLLEVLLRRHVVIRNPDTLPDRLTETAEAMELATGLDDPVPRFWAAYNRTASVIESGDLSTATEYLHEATALAARVGQPTLRWTATVARGTAVLLAGDACEAEALAAEALRLGTGTGQRDAADVYGAQLVLIRWHQGRDAEMADALATMGASNPHVPVIHAALARVWADAGQVEPARDLLQAQHVAGFSHPNNYFLLCYLCSYAEVSVRLGERAAAATLLNRLERWPDQIVYIDLGVLGAVAHYLGMLASLLGRDDLAHDSFARAQAIHERIQAPFHLARTHLERGTMLLARAQSDAGHAAEADLEIARRLAREHGCTLVDKRARELLGQQPSAGTP